jgi:hypothetical protein
MRKLTQFILFCLLISGTLSLYAQKPDSLWTKTFGGSQSDQGRCVQQTNDGGYIITGYKNFYNIAKSIWHKDIIIIKTDSTGEEEWTRTFGVDSTNEEGYSIQQTNDNGYICAGFWTVLSNAAWLCKLDSDGNTESGWPRIYNTYNGNIRAAAAYSVDQTYDGGYIVSGTIRSGSSRYKVYLIRTDSSGDTLWTKYYGITGSSNDKSYGYSVQQTSDSGYIIAGVHNIGFYFGSPPEGYLIKTDSLGNVLWERYGPFTYFGGIQETSEYRSVKEYYSNGNYYCIVTGTRWDEYPTAGVGNIFTAKYESDDGTLSDTNHYFTGSDYYEEGFSIDITNDENFILAGRIKKPDSAWDGYLIKVNTSGDTLWTRKIGNTGNEHFNSAQQTSDCNYITTGYTSSYGAGGGDIYLVKVGFPDYLSFQNDTVEAGDTANYYARDSIKAAGNSTTFVIEDDGYCTMEAGIKIDLLPGFDAQTGSFFDASIDPSFICSGSGGLSSFKTLPKSSFPENPETEKDKTEKESIPTVFSCRQNNPNPFTRSTTIKYGLPKNADVKLNVFNLAGQAVKTLVDAKQSAGYKQVSWDGQMDNGKEAPQGTYFYVLRAGDEFEKTHKMILLK